MVEILVIFFIIFTLIAAMFSLYSYEIGMDYSYFNPKCNYKRWDNLNWLGVLCGTLFIIVMFYPACLCCAVYKLFYWIFTVGRKK